MDITKYKILFDLPNNYNNLCKKYQCTYQHIYQVIKELVRQNLVVIEYNSINNIIKLTEQGQQAAKLLQDVFLLTGEIKKLDNNSNIIKGKQNRIKSSVNVEIDVNKEIDLLTQQLN